VSVSWRDIFLGVLLVVGATGSILLRPQLARERAALAPETARVSGEELEAAGVAVGSVLGPALGFFRPLTLNFLWLRFDALQKEGRFFEAASLATVISGLQPRIPEVWTYQAWNLGFNITRALTPRERYQWVDEAICLLRDRGLDENPGAAQLYRYLAWFFFFKIDGITDEANLLYKLSFARELDDVTVTSDGAPARSRQDLLKEWRLDARFLDHVARRHLGSLASGADLDLRVASVHGLYWASRGLHRASRGPTHPRRPAERWERFLLRRYVVGSLDQLLDHGRVVRSAVRDTYAFAPDLRLVDAVQRAFDEDMVSFRDDETIFAEVQTAREQLYQRVALYMVLENRRGEAREWWSRSGSATGGATLERFLALQVLRLEDREGATRELALARLAYLARGVLGLSLAAEQRLAEGVRLVAHAFREDWNADPGAVPLPGVEDAIGAIARAWALRLDASESTRALGVRLRGLVPAAFGVVGGPTAGDLRLPAPRSEEDARGVTFIPGLGTLGPESEEAP